MLARPSRPSNLRKLKWLALQRARPGDTRVRIDDGRPGATPAFELPIRISILVALLALVPIIIHSDRKRMGMFINGYRRGKTKIVALTILAVELSLYAVASFGVSTIMTGSRL